MNASFVLIGSKYPFLDILEIAEKSNLFISGIIALEPKDGAADIENIPIVGAFGEVELLEALSKTSSFFVCEDSNSARASLSQRLEDAVSHSVMANFVQPTAWVSSRAELGTGIYIGAHAFLAPKVWVDNGVYIMPNVSVEQGVHLQPYCYIGSGSALNADAHIGQGAYLGTGVTVVSGVKIGKNARIGAGSVVMQDVPAGKTYFGVPATEYK